MPTIPDEDLSIPIPAYPAAHNSQRMPALPPSHQPPNLRADPPSQSKTGQKLGQYNIIKTLGEGSFGKVKLAVHQTTGQKVALKIINKKKIVNRDMAGRVEREIQYLQLLRHPHIIKLFGVLNRPTDIVMVIEYAGGELFDYIVKYGRMDETKSRRFFQQIICAVEYCHRHKIVHRDLKPENLLLDEDLNVKIADFGLSNIMTDGNFLKTSCGSPNYAAPEVISGKLYAGPEVDVWSCGVILYVMLCGRLPFDDEYIPTLFKKIAQGNYHIPTYLSHESVSLLKKMLIVNSVNRITIAEIRQDPWFQKDLPEYLWLPTEEFQSTDLHTTKAQFQKAKAQTQKAGIHEDVVGKVSKALGFAKDDITDALAKEEPSAIKDAYMIVKDNELMKLDGKPEFQHQSPPPSWQFTHLPPISPANRPLPSPIGNTPPNFERPSSLPGTPRSRTRPPTNVPMPPAPADANAMAKDLLGSDGLPVEPEFVSAGPFSPNSTISILPTSLPDYHRAYMKGGPPSNTPAVVPAPPLRSERPSSQLKPKSSHHASAAGDDRVRNLTPIRPPSGQSSGRRSRPTKWQFGIRSRNQPLDAIACIYRALKKLGAEWLVEEEEDEEGSNDGSGSGSSRSSSRDGRDDSRNDMSAAQDDDILAPESPKRRPGQASSSSRRRRDEDNDDSRRRNEIGLPEDPWVIHCRWKKNVPAPERRGSEQSNFDPNAPKPTDTGLYVYMEIQLYQLESHFYLVDFKCAGYEREDGLQGDNALGEFATQVVNDAQSQLDSGKTASDTKSSEDGGAKMDGSGIRPMERVQSQAGSQFYGGWKRPEDKDVSSAFPFLDLASNLIIQLAEAD